MNVAQMQAAGWAGAGTVTDNARVVWSSATASKSMATTADLIVYRSFRGVADIPSPIADIESFAPSKKSIIRDSDYYEIPPFLRKQSDIPSKPVPKILDPKDVISLANEILIDKRLIGKLVEILDQSAFEVEVLEIFKTDLQFLNKEELWSAILAWILIQLEEYGEWNEKTISAIEALANGLEPTKLNKAFQIFNAKMADLGMHGWLTLDFENE